MDLIGGISMKVNKIRTLTYETNDEHTVGIVLQADEMEVNDPFLFMADDLFPENTFGLHPHRGIETVTYVIDGEVYHHDTTHGDGKISDGDVQWMTAGQGVLHSEEPKKGERSRVLQLWVNLPKDKKMIPSNYQTLKAIDMPKLNLEHVDITVFSGQLDNLRAPTKNIVPINMYEIKLKSNYSYRLSVDPKSTAFLFVLDGSGVFGANEISATKNQVVHFDQGGNELILRATEDLKVIFYSGRPINEPIAARGPFVMNTEEEVNQAFKDYREGLFHEGF